MGNLEIITGEYVCRIASVMFSKWGVVVRCPMKKEVTGIPLMPILQRRKICPKKSTQNIKLCLNKFFWTISVGFLTRVRGKKVKLFRTLQKVCVKTVLFWYFGGCSTLLGASFFFWHGIDGMSRDVGLGAFQDFGVHMVLLENMVHSPLPGIYLLVGLGALKIILGLTSRCGHSCDRNCAENAQISELSFKFCRGFFLRCLTPKTTPRNFS